MSKTKTGHKVVRTLAKGQVTIPSEFRDALGIDAETLLSVSLVGDHLELIPLRQEQAALRRYTDQDIARFLEEDRLDIETANRVQDVLRRGRP